MRKLCFGGPSALPSWLHSLKLSEKLFYRQCQHDFLMPSLCAPTLKSIKPSDLDSKRHHMGFSEEIHSARWGNTTCRSFILAFTATELCATKTSPSSSPSMMSFAIKWADNPAHKSNQKSFKSRHERRWQLDHTRAFLRMSLRSFLRKNAVRWWTGHRPFC